MKKILQDVSDDMRTPGAGITTKSTVKLGNLSTCQSSSLPLPSFLETQTTASTSGSHTTYATAPTLPPSPPLVFPACADVACSAYGPPPAFTAAFSLQECSLSHQ